MKLAYRVAQDTRSLSPAVLTLTNHCRLCDRNGPARVNWDQSDCLLFDCPEIPFPGMAHWPKYSCFFVNTADRFKGVELVQAATDTDALTYAKQLLRRVALPRRVEDSGQCGQTSRSRTLLNRKGKRTSERAPRKIISTALCRVEGPYR